MTVPDSGDAPGLIRALLTPLRAPRRVVGNIETIASALLSLQHDTQARLASVDERVGALLPVLNRVDRRVAELEKLEQAVTEQTEAIRDDINTRLAAVENEVRAMRAPIEQMSRDLATVVKLLPNPNDGPLARLRDTLTSS
jgi:chromosome segregation ATPase